MIPPCAHHIAVRWRTRQVFPGPNLVRTGVFSLDRLLSHIDPGTQEESEDFVRRICEQHHIDPSSDRDGKAVVDTDVASFMPINGSAASIPTLQIRAVQPE